MTEEIYLCPQCKTTESYYYDDNGEVCTFTPCHCQTNKPQLIIDEQRRKFDLALKQLEKLV